MGWFSSNQTGLVFFIKSQRAFCVLFCEWKEGTIITSDSHLRGDTMLNIYFGDMPEAVYNTSVYFNYTYEDEWLTSDFAKEVRCQRPSCGGKPGSGGHLAGKTVWRHKNAVADGKRPGKGIQCLNLR